MKKILITILSVFSLIFLYAQENEPNFIDYFLPVTFNNIDTPGKLFFMFQNGNISKTKKDSTLINMIEIDSSSYNYKLTFTNANIGAIEKCKYTLHVKQDTLYEVIVTVNKIRNLNQLIYQAKEQFGEPFINIENKEKLYEWHNPELNILPVLTVLKNQKEGILRISLK